ncbi:hypothetical protein diail_8114 [Diaporthe ilicicola]|nr:hypothetical protein diail_8114 [Diaporthe ilicicola]
MDNEIAQTRCYEDTGEDAMVLDHNREDAKQNKRDALQDSERGNDDRVFRKRRRAKATSLSTWKTTKTTMKRISAMKSLGSKTTTKAAMTGTKHETCSLLPVPSA